MEKHKRLLFAAIMSFLVLCCHQAVVAQLPQTIPFSQISEMVMRIMPKEKQENSSDFQKNREFADKIGVDVELIYVAEVVRAMESMGTTVTDVPEAIRALPSPSEVLAQNAASYTMPEDLNAWFKAKGAYLYFGKDGSSVPQNSDELVAEKDTTAEFTSPDLTFFELHGDVSKVEWLNYEYVYNPQTLLFDEEGKVAPVQDENGIIATFFRNSNGYINQWNTGYEGEAGEEMYLYEWSNGRVKSKLLSFYDSPEFKAEEDRYRYIYHYDDNGNLLTITQAYEGVEAGETKDTKIAYSDYKFDDMGNWISRKCTTTFKFRDAYEENPSWENRSTENKEYRVIKYRNHDAGVVKTIQQVQREWKVERE